MLLPPHCRDPRTMRPQSAKAKGRRFQQWVRDMLLGASPQLHEDDIRSTSMGAGGEDLQFSPAARAIYPISIECKCQESLSFWAAMKQAEANAGEHTPVLFVTRNRTPEYAVLPAVALISLYSRLAVAEEGGWMYNEMRD